MTNWIKTLALGVALVLPGLLPAVTQDYDAYVLDLTRVSENRRNPGEMGPVATGDFNNDGIDDIAFGSPRSAAVLTANSGNIFVVYGSDDFLNNPYYDLTAQPNQAINGLFSRLVVDNTEGFQLMPERGGEQFGHALASGDFDGDGIDDLAIGAPALFGAPSSPGAVYLLYGRDDSVTTLPLAGLELIENEIFDDMAFEILGNPAHNYFGEVVALLDLDSDGYDDLVVGSPNNPVLVNIEVIWGRPRTVPAIQQLHREVMGAVEISTIVGGGIAGERMGSSFAAGDFISTAAKELFVGCPGWPGDGTSRGRVIQLNLPKPASNFDTYNVILAPLQYRAVNVGAEFGSSIAFDQFDPDTPAELVVGAPNEDNDRGVVHIVKPAVDFPTTGTLSYDVPTTTGLTLTQTQFGAHFGQKVALESVDGFAGKDLVIGAPGFLSGSGFDHGRAYVVSGTSFLPAISMDVDITTLNGVSVGNFPSEMGGGANLAFGDFDSTPNPILPGDTFPRQDIIISGTGQSVYDPACTSNIQADWVQCNGSEVGLRAFVGLSSVLSTSESSPAWSLLP
ncbi:FG-GAP repeat protein [Candidatus Sumerlaeota bacterium]|nr:FG-GAP repeat protein [Candidatus Sumerlaeota bacterium]